MEIRSCFSGQSLTLLMLSVILALGCATAPPPPAPEPEPLDPFADFRGRWFETDVPFRLESTPMANRDLGVQVTLKKVEWTIEENRDGSERREASMVIMVSGGEETRRLRMDEGETRKVFEVTITAGKAGEDYSDTRMQYLPWVDLHIR
jgi:hypothetical protein